jgi:two-component system, cell cycle sensor histidine kinase and response regulator CckA
MAVSDNIGQSLTTSRVERVARGLAVLIALLLALAVGFAAWRFESYIQPWMIAAGASFAIVGLLALLAWFAGVFSLVGTDSDRQFYDAMTDALVDCCVVTDGKGRAVYANASYLKLASKAGVARLVGFDVLYSGYSEFAEPIYQLAQAAREGQVLHRDVRVVAGSSAPGSAPDLARWLRVAVSPLTTNSKGGRTLWRLIDITNDRTHQEQAFTRLQFIITYLDHAPVGFFSTLPSGKVDYINATLAGWLGLDLVAAQSGGMTLSSLIGENGAKILAAVAPIAGGHRIDRFSFPINDAQGAPLQLDFMSRSDFDSEGKALPGRTMVMRRDLSSNEDNSVGHNAVSQFLAAVPIGIAEVDSKGAVVGANAEFLALSSQVKLGSSLYAALKQDEVESLSDALKLASSGAGAVAHCDCVFVGDNPRSVQLTITKLPSLGDKISIFALDRTESKTLEVQLAQSQKMQAVGELASGIAHDFNNVLTPIIGFADLLLAKMRPTDAAFADVMNIKQNANRAANLVRQLLAFSRKQTLQPKVHDLSEAMADLDNLLGRVLGEKTELTISHGRDLGLVLVDIHQFEQVIINLAVNARDAMPKGGKLSVRTYNLARADSQSTGHVLPEGDYVVCEVADTGTGIPKDILDKIWAPFFTTKEVGKGTGLGLSMVYGIVKQTGGFIYCDSVMGQGTTFVIYLPRFVPDASAVVVERAIEVAPKREDFSGRGRILIVEDEDSVRAFAVRALTSRGYTVLEADSGEVGLEVVESDADGFELILSDVVMPEMDGPTMLKELRKRNITTKVIFMSGYAEEAFEKNLEGASDFAFLQKPFSLKQLVEKVKEVMG